MSRYYWEFDEKKGCNIYDRKQPGDFYTGAGRVAWSADADTAGKIVCALEAYSMVEEVRFRATALREPA